MSKVKIQNGSYLDENEKVFIVATPGEFNSQDRSNALSSTLSQNFVFENEEKDFSKHIYKISAKHLKVGETLVYPNGKYKGYRVS